MDAPGEPATTITVDGVAQRAWAWDRVTQQPARSAYAYVNYMATEMQRTTFPDAEVDELAEVIFQEHLRDRGFAGIQGLSWSGMTRLALQPTS